MSAVETKLKEMGHDLPAAAAPAANYVPYVVSGNLIYVSGQLPAINGEFKYTGKIGADLTAEDGYKAAQICAINIIAQVKAACGGDLDRVTRIVKLGGFVASTPDFTGQPGVINGASDLMAEAFGEKGPHARSAVATPVLPLDVAVEIDAIVEFA